MTPRRIRRAGGKLFEAVIRFQNVQRGGWDAGWARHLVAEDGPVRPGFPQQPHGCVRFHWLTLLAWVFAEGSQAFNMVDFMRPPGGVGSCEGLGAGSVSVRLARLGAPVTAPIRIRKNILYSGLDTEIRAIGARQAGIVIKAVPSPRRLWLFPKCDDQPWRRAILAGSSGGQRFCSDQLRGAQRLRSDAERAAAACDPMARSTSLSMVGPRADLARAT
ncbi:hypothetical protein [Rhizobium sp.]